MDAIMTDPPDAAEFERLARKAVAQLPAAFRDCIADVVIRIEEFADEEALSSVGLESPWDLLGLYHGVSLDKQSIWSSGSLPSIISLYRRPLLRHWRATGVSLEDLVNHVVVHEVGHHFGLSDAQMEAIERET
jgi:predicted Zn-dependent protease with MMP-like domain